MILFNKKDKVIDEICKNKLEVEKAKTERQNIIDNAQSTLLRADELERVKSLNYRIWSYEKDIKYLEWETNNKDFLIALQNNLLKQCAVCGTTRTLDHPTIFFTWDRANDKTIFILDDKEYIIDRMMLHDFAIKYKYTLGIDSISTD
jgi:hypothetical protein